MSEHKLGELSDRDMRALMTLADADGMELEFLELRQMARRYEFLMRDFSVMSANIDGNHSWVYRRNFSLKGPTLDAAIDAAIAKSDGKETT